MKVKGAKVKSMKVKSKKYEKKCESTKACQAVAWLKLNL